MVFSSTRGCYIYKFLLQRRLRTSAKKSTFYWWTAHHKFPGYNVEERTQTMMSTDNRIPDRTLVTDVLCRSTCSLFIWNLVALGDPSNEASWPALHCQGTRIPGHSNVRHLFRITRYLYIFIQDKSSGWYWTFEICPLFSLMHWLLCRMLFGQVTCPDYRRKSNNFTSRSPSNNAWNEGFKYSSFLDSVHGRWIPFRSPLGIDLRYK